MHLFTFIAFSRRGVGYVTWVSYVMDDLLIQLSQHRLLIYNWGILTFTFPEHSFSCLVIIEEYKQGYFYKTLSWILFDRSSLFTSHDATNPYLQLNAVTDSHKKFILDR